MPEYVTWSIPVVVVTFMVYIGILRYMPSAKMLRMYIRNIIISSVIVLSGFLAYDLLCPVGIYHQGNSPANLMGCDYSNRYPCNTSAPLVAIGVVIGIVVAAPEELLVAVGGGLVSIGGIVSESVGVGATLSEGFAVRKGVQVATRGAITPIKSKDRKNGKGSDKNDIKDPSQSRIYRLGGVNLANKERITIKTGIGKTSTFNIVASNYVEYNPSNCSLMRVGKSPKLTFVDLNTINLKIVKSRRKNTLDLVRYQGFELHHNNQQSVMSGSGTYIMIPYVLHKVYSKVLHSNHSISPKERAMHARYMVNIWKHYYSVAVTKGVCR